MKFRTKVVEHNEGPSIYFPQIKRWYGWCYFYKSTMGAGGMISEKIYFYNLGDVTLFLLTKEKEKQRPTVSYISFKDSNGLKRATDGEKV
jgi:hypothetical protein